MGSGKKQKAYTLIFLPDKIDFLKIKYYYYLVVTKLIQYVMYVVQIYGEDDSSTLIMIS